MQRTHKSGYILILTLMIMGLSLSLVTYMFLRGQLHMTYMRATIDREKARDLAVSGVQIALSKLTQFSEQSTGEQKKENKTTHEKQLLQAVFPSINRWQTINLTEKKDGVSGQIRLCIMCEEGKIPLNQWYDVKKHGFKGEGAPKGDTKKIVQDVLKRVQKETGTADLIEAFEKFLKERHYRLDDITELLTIPAFSFFKDNVFYEPPMDAQRSPEKRPVYLTDIFTTWSRKKTVNPWVFSDSLCGLLGLKRALAGDDANRQRMLREKLKDSTMKMDWSRDWYTYLQPFYGKDFVSLPKSIHAVLDTSFKPVMFSVRAEGTVNSITQRLYAIIQLIEEKQGNAVSHSGTIKRIYWL